MDPMPQRRPGAQAMHERRAQRRGPPAIAWFLLALPHFAIPATGLVYRPPAAGVVLLIWAVLMVLHNKTIRIRLSDSDWLRQPLFLFFGYCVLSTAYGYRSLATANHLVLELTTSSISYLHVAFERLLQLFLIIVAFEVMRESRHRPEQLMHWWLNGTSFAVSLHLLTYLVSRDPLVQRAGTFTEGNLAGMYYLLSLFVAYEYQRRGPAKQKTLHLLVALIGILLSRSSAAIVLTAALGAGRFVLASRYTSQRILRLVVILVVIPVVAFELYTHGLDFGIGEKLFGEELTPTSLSRIDRLESISVAYQLFETSPALGHGLQTYGFLSNDLLSGPLSELYEHDVRRIVNNIYLEIASELGLVGLGLFGLVLIRLLVLSWRCHGRDEYNLLFGVLAVLFYWNAFPSYTVVFTWAFFGLTAAIYRQTTRSAVHGALATRRVVAIPLGTERGQKLLQSQ